MTTTRRKFLSTGALAGAAAAPVFAFEVWFALHLIVVGLPHRQADTPQ